MEIILRYRRETAEAEALGIAETDRTARRLSITAYWLCVGYGILWILAH